MSRAPAAHIRCVNAANSPRTFASRTTTKTHGWVFSALGACVAASSMRSMSSSGTGSSVKSRHARWLSATSKKSVT